MCTSGFEKDAASDRPKGAIFPDGPMIQAKLMQINALFRSWSNCLDGSPMTMQLASCPAKQAKITSDEERMSSAA